MTDQTKAETLDCGCHETIMIVELPDDRHVCFLHALVWEAMEDGGSDELT
jgi:hypothetical protein